MLNERDFDEFLRELLENKENVGEGLLGNFASWIVHCARTAAYDPTIEKFLKLFCSLMEKSYASRVSLLPQEIDILNRLTKEIDIIAGGINIEYITAQIAQEYLQDFSEKIKKRIKIYKTT